MPSARLHAWATRLGVPVLLLVILIGVYWKLVLVNQYDWMWSPDMAQQVLPWFDEESRQVHNGRLPMWDPHVWDGQPLLAQAQPGAAYPLNWLLFALPRTNDHIDMLLLQWYYVLERWMAALFCYLLCRELGRSRTASLAGGLIFALVGYIGTTDWPQMVNGAVWTPLVLLFLLRAGRGDRPLASAALCGLFWGVSWLSGHHQVPIFISLMTGGVWLYYALRKRRLDWRMLGLAALSIAIMLLVGAFQTLPASEYGHLAKRWAGGNEPLSWDQPVPYSVHNQYSLKVWSLAGILYPGLHQNADPYLGVVAFALALIGVVAAWKQPPVKLLGAVALGGIVYALGSNSVFQGALYAVIPMVDKARSPSMAVVIFAAGAAALAAFGVDHLAYLRDSLWGRRITTGLAVFGLFTWALMIGVMFANKMGWPMDDRVGITGLSAILLAGIFYAWRTGNLAARPAGVLMVLLFLLEAGNVAGYTFADRADAGMQRYLDRTRGNKDLAEYLQQQAKPFRVNVQEEALAPNWAEYYDLDGYFAYTASLTTNFMETEFHTPQTKKLFGVRYEVGKKADSPEEQAVYEGAGGVKVFYNGAAFPRAWSVHEIVPVKSAEQGRVFIRDHVDELRWKVMLKEPGPSSLKACNSGDEVVFRRYTPDRVFLRATLACDGMVVLSDNYYPGWKATVDGKPARIYEANLAMRAVSVPQGVHEVQFRYRPASVFTGGALSVIGLVAACALAFFGRKNGRAALT